MKRLILVVLFGFCASLAGAAACMLLWSAGENLALLTGCALTVVLRLCAAVFRWSLPKA